jgi:hypothetical protein
LRIYTGRFVLREKGSGIYTIFQPITSHARRLASAAGMVI